MEGCQSRTPSECKQYAWTLFLYTFSPAQYRIQNMFPWAFLPSLLHKMKLYVFRKPYFRESPKIRMSTPARRRLMRDFKRLQQDPPAGQFLLSRRFFDQIVPPGVSGAPSDNNIMLWNAVIFGPHDTPFEVIIQSLFVGRETLHALVTHIQ